MMQPSLIRSLTENDIRIFRKEFKGLIKEVKNNLSESDAINILQALKHSQSATNGIVQNVIDELFLFMTNPSETRFMKQGSELQLNDAQLQEIPLLLAGHLEAAINKLKRHLAINAQAAELARVRQELADAQATLAHQQPKPIS